MPLHIWPLSKFYVGCGNMPPVYPDASMKIEKEKLGLWRFYERFFPIIFRLFSKAAAYFQILPDIMSLNSSDLWKRSFDKSNENLCLLWSWAFHNLQSDYTTSFMTSKWSYETVFELLKYSNNIQYQNLERKQTSLTSTKLYCPFYDFTTHTKYVCTLYDFNTWPNKIKQKSTAMLI